MSYLRDLAYGISFNIEDSSLSRAGKLQDDIDANFKKMGKGVDNVNNNLKDSGKFLDNLKHKTSDVEAGIKNIKKTIAGAWATKKAIDFGKYAVGTFADFEQGMANVRATMGQISDVDFKKLQKAAIEGGSTTVYTSTEASHALNYMALAGFKVEESIESLPIILDLTAAGNLDLARSSDIVTDAMSALSLEVSDLKMFADQLAKTSQTTNTNIDQLGTAMIIAGGQAVDTGMDIQSLNTWLGILANSGYKGAKGGTALRNVLLKLTSPLEKNAELLQDLGIDIADKSTGKIRGLNDILLDLRGQLGKYTEAQQNAILASLGGAENVQALRIVLKGAGDDYEDLKRDIEDSEDAAKNMAATQRDTLQGAIKEVGSAIDGTVISILDSTSVLTGFKDLIKTIAGGLNEITGSMTKVEEMKTDLNLFKQNQSDLTNPRPELILQDDIDNLEKRIKQEEENRKEAIKEAKSEVWEVAKKPVTGVARVGGGIAGAKAGRAIGGLPGMAIGGTIGLLTPEIAKVGMAIKNKITKEAEASNEELTGWAKRLQEFQDGLNSLKIPKFDIDIPNPVPNVLYNPMPKSNLIDWERNKKNKNKTSTKTTPMNKPSTNLIRGFATGTHNTPDTFIAGEKGPELITNLPNRRVYNSNETKEILENKSTTINPQITIHINGANQSQFEIAQAVKREIKDYFDTLSLQI